MRDDAAGPDGSGVERGVRPRAWIGPSGQTMPDEIYVAWATSYPADAKHFAPLYDQAALDAAVAAERERWESALGAVMPADFKDWHQNSAMERPAAAAWVIRNLRDREAHLEGVLAGVQDGA